MTRNGIREWIRDVINSSTTQEHLVASRNLILNYSSIYETTDGLLDVLNDRKEVLEEAEGKILS